MLTLHGTGVSNGIAIGMAFVLQPDKPEIPEYLISEDQLAFEIERFQNAVNRATQQMLGIKRKTADHSTL